VGGAGFACLLASVFHVSTRTTVISPRSSQIEDSIATARDAGTVQ